MIPCPATETLRELLDERLAPGERDEIAQHVETCTDCEQALDQLAGEQVSWLSVPNLDPVRLGVPTGGRFRLGGRFAVGGQGDVYIARDQELQRDVAVKRTKEGASDAWRHRAELIREALITGSLEHPGIVPVYSLGYDGDGRSYYAMRLIRGIAEGKDRGDTLEDAIADFQGSAPTWTLRKLLDRFIAVCNTIQYAHDQGVLHCDLKPRNIILGPYGETLVLDWGAARAIHEPPAARPPETPGHLERNGHETRPTVPDSSHAGHYMLTPAYASPELRAGRLGELGRASDIYSLGVILSCILTGKPPARGDRGQGVVERPGGNPAQPPAPSRSRRIPRALEAVCNKALADRPEARYPSARALADEVSRWLADEPVRANREGMLDRLVRLARRHRSWAVAGAAALLLVTLVSMACAWWVNRERVGALELSAALARDRGDLLCERGDVSEGALWLARSLEISEREQGDTRRVSLAAWSRRLCTLTSYYSLPDGLSPVWSAATGRLVLAMTKEGDTRFWNVSERRPVSTDLPNWKHSRPLFGREGRFILVIGEDHVGRVCDTTSGKAIGRPIEHLEDVRAVGFSSDGNSLVIGCGDGTAQAWDVRSGNPLRSVRHPKAVQAVSLANDGGTALSGTEDGEVWAWSTRTGQRIGSPIRHGRGRPILAVALSPDVQTVMTSSVNDVVRFWKTSTGEPIPGDHDKFAPIWFVRFSEDRRLALGVFEDATMRVLDISSGKVVGRPMRHPGIPSIARLSADGRAALTAGADMAVRLWRVESGELAAAPMMHEASVAAMGFAADGRNVITVSHEGALRVWQPPDEVAGATLRPLKAVMDVRKTRPGVPLPSAPKNSPLAPDWIRAVSFNASEQVVLTGTVGGRVQLWDAATGQPLGIPIQDVPPLLAAGLSPDGTRALVTAGDRTVKLWDLNSGRLLQVLPHDDIPLAVSFLPMLEGHSTVTGGFDRKARIWNLVTGELMVPQMDHDAVVNAVASTPDGHMVLTGSQDGTVRKWDARTGRPIGAPLRLARSASTIDFSPDGRVVLIGGTDTIGRMFELEGGKPVGRLLPHRDTIYGAAFRRDGRIVLTASDDGLIQAWEVETGKPVGPRTVQEGGICSLALGPGGTLVTGSKTGLARLWELVGPVEGDPDRLRRNLEITTGLEIDRNGATEILEPGDWEERRARLRELERQADAR